MLSESRRDLDFKLPSINDLDISCDLFSDRYNSIFYLRNDSIKVQLIIDFIGNSLSLKLFCLSLMLT